jgi:hypothetical protein
MDYDETSARARQAPVETVRALMQGINAAAEIW